MEWHEAGDLGSMVKANEWVLETIRLALEEGIYRFGEVKIVRFDRPANVKKGADHDSSGRHYGKRPQNLSPGKKITLKNLNTILGIKCDIDTR